MKHLKKIFALAMALFMAIAVVTPALAEPTQKAPGTGTITIYPPANAAGENTYKIYKVFDATIGDNGEVAYKLMENVTTAPDGFTVTRGYITDAPENLDAQATALKNYNAKVLVDTVTTQDTTAGMSKSLDPGYYYIETSTGTAVYVENGANIVIEDKNTITVVKKSAGTEYDADSLRAIAAVGTDQPFTAVITKGKGAKNVVFTDTMTNMTFNENSLTIKVNGVGVAADNYTVSPNDNLSGFTVRFEDDFIAGLEESTQITLNYTGKIQSEALSANPATNTATVTSGDNNSNTSTTETVEVYNAKLTVNKVNGSNEPLEGAKFKLKNNETGLYYAGHTNTNTGETANWTTTGVEVEASAVLDEEGNTTAYAAVFEGLGVGEYTLEESTVPAGYNKAADKVIEVVDNDFTTVNLEQTATVENQTGTVLPSTGGIGTTLFYVIGGILVAGAAIALVVKNRVAKIEG